MNLLLSAIWVETLKAYRSKVLLFTTLGFMLAPLMGGLFMVIMKDPQKAREMGLLSTKALLVMDTAEWATYFGMLAQAVAIGGTILFSIATSWVFGREFSDRTAKDLMSLPTSREKIVIAKFIVIFIWAILATILIFLVGLMIGNAVDIPGWTNQLASESFLTTIGAGLLTLALIPLVAFFATFGKGYLPPMGWAVLTIFLAQIVAATGWGDWFPWSVPALFSGVVGPRAEQLGLHSYIIVLLTFGFGLFITFYQWRNADQTN